MNWFYLISVVVVGLLALLPLAYLEGRDPHQYDPYASPGAHSPIVRYDSYGSAVKTLDPANCGDTTSSGIQGNIWEGLYTYDYIIRPPKVVPQLAAAPPEVSEDRLTYTIKLRPGVTYHPNPCFGINADGSFKTRTVRAADFETAFKRIADYHVQADLSWTFLSDRLAGIDEFRDKSKSFAPGDFSRYDLPVEGVKAVDELTLQLKVADPFPQFIYVLGMHVYAPVPREAVEYWFGAEPDGRGGRRPIPPDRPRSTEFLEAEQVVGTGPYLLKTFERKHQIVLVRNPAFRPETYPEIPDRTGLTEQEWQSVQDAIDAGLYRDAGQRVPFIDVLEYKYVEEQYSAWMRFLSKQTDASGIPKETFEFVITPGQDLTDSWRKRHIYLLKYDSPAIYWIVFNQEDPVLGASKSLRQALCLCFDAGNYIKVLRNGRGKRPVNMIPSSFKGHAEAGQGRYFQLDEDAARAKIVEAKKELGRAGLLVNGEVPELKFEVGDTGPTTVIQTDFVRQQFAKVGVRVKPIFNDWPTLQRKVHSKEAQMYFMGWHADYPDAENFLQLFYSPNIEKHTNNANFSNARFDERYRQARTMPDSPERTELYAEMARIISEECPILPVDEAVGYVLFYEWVSNVKHHPIGYGFAKYQRIDDALRRKLGGR